MIIGTLRIIKNEKQFCKSTIIQAGFQIPGMWFLTLPYGVQSKSGEQRSNKIAYNGYNGV
jgi:hypothetical protein